MLLLSVIMRLKSVYCILVDSLNEKEYTEMYLRERADIALKQCLDTNYVQLGAYKKEDLKDYSGWTYNIF